MKRLAFADPLFRNLECVVTVGVFDGLHRGHLAIIGQCTELAHELGCASVAVTFNVNPKMEKGSETFRKPLMSPRDMERMLEEKGVQYHCVIDFSEDMSKLSGEEFIALLCTRYKVRAMVVGSSFRCGTPAKSAGPAEIGKLLCTYTSSAFLKVVSPVLHNGAGISSSLIRRCLLEGNTGSIPALLGRPYSLDMEGQGFLTAPDGRLLYSTDTICQLLPCAGSYSVKVAGFAEGAPMPGPVDCDASAVISGDCLALDLPIRIKPDRIFFL